MPRSAPCAKELRTNRMESSHRVLQLRGGARLVAEPMPERHSTTVVLMFAGGSRLEEGELGGVSHFIEHLFFKGTRRRPSSKEIADAIEGVGGFINASTDKELTAYWTRVPAEHLALGVDVLLDIVSNSNLAPADVERERMVILEELRMYQDQPQDFVQNLFEEAMWPGHPLGRDIAGTEQSVARLTRDDILEFANWRCRRADGASTCELGVDTAGGARWRPISGHTSRARCFAGCDATAAHRASPYLHGRPRLQLSAPRPLCAGPPQHRPGRRHELTAFPQHPRTVGSCVRRAQLHAEASGHRFARRVPGRRAQESSAGGGRGDGRDAGGARAGTDGRGAL